MNEANTKKFADEFCNMVQSLMIQFECIGNWKWGNPAGQTEPIPTYELTARFGVQLMNMLMLEQGFPIEKVFWLLFL